jgi:antitoxin ParD1/3/4
MNVSLTPDLEELIRKKVESGYYSDSSAVVCEALRLLEERDRDKLDRLRAAIAIGLEEIERGEAIPFTPELMAEIDLEVDERVRRGDVPNPDVCP